MVSKKIILSNVNRLCKLRDLQNSFIRISLDEISLERYQILYHVVKNKLIKSKKIIKCIYNSRISSYELIYIINNKLTGICQLVKIILVYGNCHILLIKIPLLIKIKIKLQVLDD